MVIAFHFLILSSAFDLLLADARTELIFSKGRGQAHTSVYILKMDKVAQPRCSSSRSKRRCSGSRRTRRPSRRCWSCRRVAEHGHMWVSPLFHKIMRGHGSAVSPLPGTAGHSPFQASGLQESAAPMYQLAPEAPWVRDAQNAPSFTPSLEPPPRSGTRAPLLLNQQASQ